MVRKAIQRLYLSTLKNKIIPRLIRFSFSLKKVLYFHRELSAVAVIIMLLVAGCRPTPAIRELVQGGDTLIITPGDIPDKLTAKLSASFFAVYPQYRKHFNKQAPQKVYVNVSTAGSQHPRGASANNSIHLYLANMEEDYGPVLETFCHELVHPLQRYPGTVDRWIKEGMADYANYKYGVITDAWRTDSFANTPRPGILWSSGYQHTAKFFMWLDAIYPHFTLNLNEACLSGNYQDTSYFSVHAGRSLPELWDDYVAP